MVLCTRKEVYVGWELQADRMHVNAALTRLTESFDDAAARDVIRAFHDLPAETKYRPEIVQQRPGGGSVTGTTPQHGDVGVSDDRPTVTVRGGARHVERVGHFKLSRISRGHDAEITIRPYWASDITTATEPRSQWSLWYRIGDLAPLAFIRYDWVPGRNPMRELWIGLRDFFTGQTTQYQYWTAKPTVLFSATFCRFEY